MKKVLFVLAAVVLSAAVITSITFADKEKEKAQSAEQDAYMKAYMEAIAPNEHHEAFKHRAGEWKAEVKVWQAPNTEPAVSAGKSKYELVMDGRFLKQHMEGEVMGMPFVGMGVSGYDKTIGKHTSYWFDSMGTQSVYSEGECSDHCKKEWYHITTKDPVSGTEYKVKMVTNVIDENKHVFQWFVALPDGQEFKSMEIVYTRI